MRTCGMLAVAATLIGIAAIPAEAGTRVYFGYQPYYPGYDRYYGAPRYYRLPRRHYYYNPGYAYDYEPEFYDEPEYDAPRVYRPPQQGSVDKKQPAQKKAKATASLISCSKATKIVTGFGFSSVKSTNCKGQVYSFKAVRDGKNFSVKLSAKNGELTEVKKL